MSIIREFEIVADTSEAIDAVEQLKESIDNTTESYEKQSEAAKKANKEAAENAREQQKALDSAAREGLSLLDKLTGGLASSFKKAYTGVQGLVKGIGGIKGAIAATGIGLLVVGIGELIKNWDSVKGAIIGATDATTKQAEEAGKIADAQMAALESISAQENVLKEQGKTEREIRDLKIQQTEEAIAASEVQIEALKQRKKEEQASFERTAQFTKAIVRAVTLPIQLGLNMLDMLINALPDSVKSFLGIEGTSTKAEDFTSYLTEFIIGTPEQASEATDKALDAASKSLEKLRNQRAGYVLQNRKEEEEAAKRLQEARDKEAEERLRKKQEELKLLAQAEENYRKQQQAIADKYDELVLSKQVSQEQQEINATYDKFFALEEAYADNAEALQMIEEQRNAELAAINKKYRDAEEKEEQERLNKRLKNRQEIQNLIVDSANATIKNLMDLNNIYDKDNEAAAKAAFERNKALQIVQAIINTASGIMGQLSVPQDQLTGANFVKAAVIAATGATQIATIKSQQFNGGKSTSGGTTPTAPAVPQVAPQFNIVGASGTNQLLQGIAGQFNQPLRAYVVGGDVTSAQEVERKRIKTATFG
jgi:hypothetical protein